MLTKINKTKIICFLCLILFILLVPGCLKDNATAPILGVVDDKAEFLLYLEEEGDIINNILPPSVQAEEVYNNLGNYLIIDLRDSISFQNGHIQGAKNIPKDLLYVFVQNNYRNFSKLILVSASGQAAAYYSLLLRFGGCGNIYFMNYGMAAWNTAFATVWTDRIRTYSGTSVFTRIIYDKGKFSALPSINSASPGESMKDLANRRIGELIKAGFDEDYNSLYSKVSMTFEYWLDNYSELYTICSGPLILYVSNPLTTNTFHLSEAISYLVYPDPSDFRSTANLQTLPPDSTIAIYGATGQESAFYTAYLRLLGYDAKSILFGVNNFNYNMLLRAPEIDPFAFRSSYIMNYPYITGPG